MNCQQGDLARILPGTGYEELTDKIVVCEALVAGHLEPAWELRDPIQIRSLFGIPSFVVTISDSLLRPIRGGEGKDETLEWLPVPDIELHPV